MFPFNLNTFASLLPSIASIVGSDDPIQNPHIIRRNFSVGGVVEGEGGEIVQPPGGEAVKLKGPSHAGGGVDINAPAGTTFFSKRVKGPDGRTMADRKASRDRLLKKLQKDLADNPADVIHKAAAKRGFETSVMEELSDIAIMQSEFNKTQQKGRKPKMATGGDPWQGSYFYGESPSAASRVGKGYSWDQPFDPYYFQKAYFKDPAQWDNVVGKNTAAAMTTPEGQKLLQEMGTQYQAINEVGPEGANGIAASRRNILNTQAPVTVPDNPISVDTTGADIRAAPPGMYSPFEASTVPDQYTPTEDPLAGYTADPNAQSGNAATDSGLDLTAGDIASIAGPIGKTLVTIGNRLGDRPTPNYYANYGTEGLQLGRKAIEGAAAQKDLDLQSNNALVNALRRNRGARSVNTARAYDVATLTQAGRNANRISATFRQALSDATARVGAQATNRDRMLAEGKRFADTTDTRNRDAFATNLGTNIGDITAGVQHQEKNRLRRKLGISNEFSQIVSQLYDMINNRDLNGF